MKYHNVYCKWAQKCTVNCIKLEQKKAIKKVVDHAKFVVAKLV